MRKPLFIFALAAALGSTASGAPDDPEMAVLGQEIARVENVVGGWERAGTVTQVLTILVGVLGAVVALHLPFKRKWIKGAVAIAGLLVTTLTVVNSSAFLTDYRGYRRNALGARALLRSIHLKQSRMPTDLEARRATVDQIADLIKEIDSMEINLGAPVPHASVSFIPPAFAETPPGPPPSWVESPPTDPPTLYFVGTSASPSLATAKLDCWQRLTESAAQVIESQLPKTEVDSRELAKHLAQGAKQVDAYVSFEESKKLYSYYCLGMIRKAWLRSDTILYGVREKKPMPESVVQASQEIKPAPADYSKRRTDSYLKLLDDSKQATPPELYRKFEQGRQLRRQGDSAGAIRVLEGVVAEKPDFFLAWYNLGLAYEETNDGAKADGAYMKAVALEPEQRQRDASIYNTYGAFLANSGRWEPAKKHFQKALELDPQHPLAKRNLKLSPGQH